MIIRNDAIGDAVISLPLIKCLSKKYEVHVLASEINYFVYENEKNIKLINLEKPEKELLFFALQLPYELEDAFKHREPHRVTNFLISLAGKLHSFYNSNKVAGDKREEIRLKLLAVVATIIKTGLNILGIDVKERM